MTDRHSPRIVAPPLTNRPDPLTDIRLVNTPAHDPDHISDKEAKRCREELAITPAVHYTREILTSIAAWGHVTEEQIQVLCPKIPPEVLSEIVPALHVAGYTRTHTDCPTCREIVIVSLRNSQALGRLVDGWGETHKKAFYGEQPSSETAPAILCPPPQLSKHNAAATELACRLGAFLPAGWILGARDAKCSAMLRMPLAAKRDSMWRRGGTSAFVEKWADLVYVRESDGLRIAVEVTVTQGRGQLAAKARWWGASIAARGGPEQAGLRVVLLSPPGRNVAEKGIEDAFPASARQDDPEKRMLALSGVLSANWDEWVDGDKTPSAEAGWPAYEHTGRKKKRIRLSDLDGGDSRWAEGVKSSWEKKELKGCIRTGE